MKWLADENFPYASFRLLQSEGFDIEHMGVVNPGAKDPNVMHKAIQEGRIILTFDSDFGELVFRNGMQPCGVVYFRLIDYLSHEPALLLLQILEKNYPIESFFTVISPESIRQKLIPSP